MSRMTPLTPTDAAALIARINQLCSATLAIYCGNPQGHVLTDLGTPAKVASAPLLAVRKIHRRSGGRVRYSLMVTGSPANLEGLTPAALSIVRFLSVSSPATTNQLATGTKLKPATISNVMTDLKRRGLVTADPIRESASQDQQLANVG